MMKYWIWTTKYAANLAFWPNLHRSTSVYFIYLYQSQCLVYFDDKLGYMPNIPVLHRCHIHLEIRDVKDSCTWHDVRNFSVRKGKKGGFIFIFWLVIFSNSKCAIWSLYRERSVFRNFFLYSMPVMLSLKCGAVRWRLNCAEFLSSTGVIQLNVRLSVSSQWLQWKACQGSILPFIVNRI